MIERLALKLLVIGVLVGASIVSPGRADAISAAVCGPAITGVSPNVGGSNGGTLVTVTGCGFTGATSVQFGNEPANGFRINSDTEIGAWSPARWYPPLTGAVDITVTTPAGTSPVQSADQFTYVTPGPCTGPLTLTASPPSPQLSGPVVTFTATASGCPTTPLYEFWMRATTDPTWHPVSSYSAGPDPST